MNTQKGKDITTGRSVFIQRLINIIPKGLRLRLNPRRYAIETFIKRSSRKVRTGAKVLDAGAGPCPYKHMFSHCNYEATDFNDPYGMMDFVCRLDKIPKKNNSYDSIVCIEVLEHVENPEKVLKEFNRLLKKEGSLYLTTPQAWMVHQKPYNFFYFTNFGLEYLLKKAGFKRFIVKPMGGYFWFLADVIRFNHLVEQLRRYPILYYPLKLIEFPITKAIIPLVLFYLDFLDRKRDWTMGYTVEAIK